MHKKPFLEAAIKGTGWQEFKDKHKLPETESFKTLIEKTEMFRYPGDFYKIYYKGDMNTTDQWIVVTNNGRYYKAGTSFMVWQPNGNATACKSVKSLKLVLAALFKGESISFGSDY